MPLRESSRYRIYQKLQDSDEELQKLKDKHPEIYFHRDIDKTKDVYIMSDQEKIRMKTEKL